MWRSIAGVVVGYVGMAVVVFCVLTVAYLGMGANRAFETSSFRPSHLWIAIEIVVGFVAAAIGGWLCMVIAKKRGAVVALIVVILALSVLSIVHALNVARLPEAVREGGLSNLQAMAHARPPLWLAFFNPVLGAVGVWFGARFKRD